MTKSRYLTTLNLDPFLKNAIGAHSLFENMLDRVEHANSGNYPPYNIIEVDEDHYIIEVAVAGFKKDEITVLVENGQLIVRGFQEAVITEEGDPEGVCAALANRTYLHQGISSRSFERSWQLADHVEVTEASIEDGILKVELAREVPEALQPKKIEIK